MTKLGGRCIVHKSRHPQKCGVGLRRRENQHRLSSTVIVPCKQSCCNHAQILYFSAEKVQKCFSGRSSAPDTLGSLPAPQTPYWVFGRKSREGRMGKGGEAGKGEEKGREVRELCTLFLWRINLNLNSNNYLTFIFWHFHNPL